MDASQRLRDVIVVIVARAADCENSIEEKDDELWEAVELKNGSRTAKWHAAQDKEVHPVGVRVPNGHYIVRVIPNTYLTIGFGKVIRTMSESTLLA